MTGRIPSRWRSLAAWLGRRPPAVDPTPAATIVLLDVENQCMSLPLLDALVRTARTLGEGGPVRVFAAAGEQNMAKFTPWCRRLAVRLVPASTRPSGADHVLLAIGDAARAVDPDVRVVVVSGDHAFARLAPQVVLVRGGQDIAHDLEVAAGQVLLLSDAELEESRARMGRQKTPAQVARARRYRQRRRARQRQTAAT